MKRIIFVFALAFLAQGVSAQSRWGLRTGLNYSLHGIELNQALNSAQGIFEGQTQDDGYHLGLFGRQFLGDQLFASGSLIYGKDMQFITHTVNGVSTNARFDNQFLQLVTL